MHTIACARAHESTCSCSCNHTLHGYLSGVLSTEQHRRVREPVLALVAEAAGPDAPLHAERALHELDHLLGAASEHLAKGALNNSTLDALVTAVLDASADQQAADVDAIVAAEAEAVSALAEGAAEAIAADERAADAELAAQLAQAEAAEVRDAAALTMAEASEEVAEAQQVAAEEIAAAQDAEREAERQATIAEGEAAAAVDLAFNAEADADRRIAAAEAAAAAAQQDAAQRAAEAEDLAAAAIEEAVAEADAAEREAAQRVADAEAIAAAALEREQRAEATTAWALGRLHLMCGLCVAAEAQAERDEGTARMVVAEFLDATFGPTAATPLGDAELVALRGAVEQALGDEVAASLLALESEPSPDQLKVLAIAFCPDPDEHPEVAQFQADLTASVVRSLVAEG